MGDLSNWDTSKVTNMYGMYSATGHNAATCSIGDLSNWDTSNVTDMNSMFAYAGNGADVFNISYISNWDTSNVTDMNNMFANVGYNATTWSIGDLSNWNTSNVTDMNSMFANAGYSATTWSIGDLSSWDTSNVTSMSRMFYGTGYSATTWNSIGTLKVYASNIYGMFENNLMAKATLNIYSDPTDYSKTFNDAATGSNALITVNYGCDVTNIDDIIATKSSNSNVVKGRSLCETGQKDLKVGDYITLTPDKSTYTIPASATGYDSDQTITPNELTLWRVININDDGTIDAVSEYTSSTNVYFQGTRGYADFVGELQTLAAQYAKSGYTYSVRMMGYDGQTLTISDTSVFDGTSTTAPSEITTPSPTSGTGQEYQGGVTGDTLYLKDYQLVSNVYKQDNNTTNYCDTGVCAYKQGTTTKTPYWLSSRRYGYSSSTGFYFDGRGIGTRGTFYNVSLRDYNSRWVDHSYGNALRPIITLKSGILADGGSGTKDSPYSLTNSGSSSTNTVNVVVSNGTISGDSTKSVNQNETVTFTISPSSGYTGIGVTPSCTNGQTATLNGNTLSITPTSDTTCTITLVRVKAENIGYNPPTGITHTDVQSMVDYLAELLS